MKKFTKTAAVIVIAAFAMIIPGCAATKVSPGASSTGTRYTVNDKFIESGFEQFKPPQPGEEIGVISTSLGEIRVRLFPEYAPKAVENFKGHANNKYYDNGIFHRVINNFMIQGGDPLQNGMGGESIWGGGFEVEINPNLHHIRGALSMARGQSMDSQGSQFFIVHTNDLDKMDPSGSLVEELNYLLENQDENLGGEGEEPVYPRDMVPAPFINSYLEFGGAYSLDFQYTVFGQVFEGMDIVDAIAEVQTSSDPATQDRPLVDVTINSVRIEKYE